MLVWQIIACEAQSPTMSALPRAGEAGSLDEQRVIVRSYEMAAVSAEINALILRLPAREGDQFRKGDILIELDCRRLDAEIDASTAAYSALRAAYQAQKELRVHAATGRLNVDQARFEMEKAEAENRALKVRRTGCSIVAPFDGRVVEKLAQSHEIAQPNQPLIRIVNNEKLEIVLIVPSRMISVLLPGTVFDVRLDETGEAHEARILQSTGAIDPISQSVRLIAEFVASPTNVAPGMSGVALFKQDWMLR